MAWAGTGGRPSSKPELHFSTSVRLQKSHHELIAGIPEEDRKPGRDTGEVG